MKHIEDFFTLDDEQRQPIYNKIGDYLVAGRFNDAARTATVIRDKAYRLDQMARIYEFWAQINPRRYRELGNIHNEMHKLTGDVEHRALSMNYHHRARRAEIPRNPSASSEPHGHALGVGFTLR